MRRSEAAIFDVDGMLLDTREFIFQAYEHALALHGHTIPNRAAIAAQVGRSLPDCYRALAPNGKIAELCLTHNNFQAGHMELIKLIQVLSHY